MSWIYLLIASDVVSIVVEEVGDVDLDIAEADVELKTSESAVIRGKD